MEKTETERQGGFKGSEGEDKKGRSCGGTRATQEVKKERRKEKRKKKRKKASYEVLTPSSRKFQNLHTPTLTPKSSE